MGFNSVFKVLKKLDDGQSPKKEDCVS